MRNIGKLLCLASCMSLSMQAQRTPEHPMDIQQVNMDQISNFFGEWMTQQGRPADISALDDEFYISRTRPLPRITEGDYQANDLAKPGRKMLLWVPLDDPTVTWKSFPRYCFEGDNFSMWSYINIHGNWTSPWVRASAGLTDVAAKNGVTVGCVLSIPWAQSVSIPGYSGHSLTMTTIMKQEGQKYIYAAPLVKMMKYYGINGLGCNSEFYANPRTMATIQGFFKACHEEAKKIDWNFQVHWYDGTNDRGSISFDNGLGSHNEKMFGDKDNIVTDAMFANYNWYSSTLTNSAAKAKELGRDPYDYYAGFDIQGRSLTNPNWSSLINSEISVGFWGAHAQSLIHQSSTDNGSADLAIQQAYLEKQELIFSGGNRNPACVPSVNTGCGLDNAGLKGKNGFHGIASLVSAKSTIQQVPFVSRFNLGNGLSFRNEGKVAFDHKWYNLSTQDILPTWRWWITNAQDVVTEADLDKLANVELTFDDAYFGGSCLAMTGQTDFSRVKLFKTMLDVQPTYELSVTYKTLKELDTHAKLFVALKGDLKTYKEIEIPAAQEIGEWTTFTCKASELGLKAGDKVAMMGIVLQNTPAGYGMHVGEMALRNPEQKFTPVAPAIKDIEVLRGRFNQCDFKMRYVADEKDGWDNKVYNDDVDTWYYEIFFQQKGQAEQLLTATTSWAAYVVDAPMVSGIENRSCRFGVRAVSPDGKQKSEISWSAYQEVAYDQPSTKVVCDKAVIKPGQEFTLSYYDEMCPAAQQWKIVDPVTGTEVATAKDATSCTTTIDKVGLYDLCVVDSKGVSTWTRGFVNISPAETGAMPEINSVTSNKMTAVAGEEVEFTYDGKIGEGSVSRALVVGDPKMFMVPGDVQKGKIYSIAVWFKADKFAHDKQGTNLINKNSIADKWPHNNWGDFWVTIRPEHQGTVANEISFNTMGWQAHDQPNPTVMTRGYGITPGVWNHVVVTQDDRDYQKIYLNGRKMCEDRFNASTRRENLGMSDSRIDVNAVANIFFGGGGVYKSGFNGAIDEVQVWDKALSDEEVLQAMKGFKEDAIPAGLQAYYTFETMEADGTFKNLGKFGEANGKVVVMEGSGGEGTASASYVQKEADNSITGVPSIPGSLQITGKAKWTVPTGAEVKVEGNVATYTFMTTGQKNATLTLANNWGEVSKTVENIVEISVPEGIEGVEGETEMSVFPNPFVESVNLRFAQAGQYTVNVIGSNGALLQQNAFNVQGGEQVNVAIQGAPGMYLLQVVNGNKNVKTLKVLKK